MEETPREKCMALVKGWGLDETKLTPLDVEMMADSIATFTGEEVGQATQSLRRRVNELEQRLSVYTDEEEDIPTSLVWGFTVHFHLLGMPTITRLMPTPPRAGDFLWLEPTPKSESERYVVQAMTFALAPEDQDLAIRVVHCDILPHEWNYYCMR
jgi:hypothetical protein